MTGAHSQLILAEDRSLGHFLYGLMCAFPLFLVPVVLSLLINFSQRQVAPASLMGSHLRWQRHSIFGLLMLMLLGYWVSALWLSLSFFALGMIWFSYRIFKGWLNLTDGVAM
ncbi:hypothetical protein KDN34_11840 [Shewanella yunxiaonensis]|uniref:DUF4870 domain-containing protein n=1 Tax=Shewanella yunxiaonensis TaxID=2829809 RepID=A0ABX7YRW9_9GAMM|nr:MULTISPECIES: hypothetical protein [Shewanella]MDF0533719.1 hypothetical protein [Shewanella sp. A32]QUN04926.1 hypothetical protein KDN34_11840 [Shewanella yunxiaonensis]